ncbi:thiazole tautomerase TenI [Aquibacillus halophilus]|uniref:Thiazole tautomerase TenI n=1 Tax=Aquibacillus halophilus TaxID=930132 RepID=A0A6A8DDD4_9BACI|nr:thiazole tautomerase TenI [Aquibacillus halophilus]MRH41829.1 thiazole tautomerase TenI [Aquibacillus halophilus]
MSNRKLHVISTGNQTPENLAKIVGEIHPFIDAIHIREKHRSARDIFNIVTLLVNRSVPLAKIIVNDRIDVAHVKNVKGVQLGYNSLSPEIVKRNFPSLQVGCSVHTLEEASLAQKQGIDYLLFGHIFPTDSKLGLVPKGLEELKDITIDLEIPVIAIGGIKPHHVCEVIEAGAAGIAVMSGVLEAKDPLEQVKSYSQNLLNT